ncbi:HD-GYP domain-containing protein [Paenibacillus paridis]|uniref:HD-GYP domain-containing protein n=1 Tax=Paenibacillus paridis TaxID=2583376 RepID=UPI001390B2F1|nr:HD-GYP domain-containing protein [Paenibacillus paridis]
MKDEWKRCKDEPAFCPVSYKRDGRMYWSLFLLSGFMAIGFNFAFESELLLMLYAFPIVFLAMLQITIPQFAVTGILLLSTIVLLNPVSVVLLSVTAAFALLILIVKRVVWVSQQHFNEKTNQEDMLMSTMFSLAKTIDARDHYTAYHSNNVAEYARSIAKEMRLPSREVDSIYLAGLIHDIGKIGTPDLILHKESRLSDEEYDIMKQHSEAGYQIVKDMKRLKDLGVADMVRFHHERPDGKGYPSGLKGEEIPLGARIIGVADAFDAMTTNRSYRQKLSADTAAEELAKYSGSQFDPAAAKAFLSVLVREGKLTAESNRRTAAQVAIAN